MTHHSIMDLIFNAAHCRDCILDANSADCFVLGIYSQSMDDSLPRFLYKVHFSLCVIAIECSYANKDAVLFCNFDKYPAISPIL